ncbi:MAG: ATP synthase F1 subunit delta [Patescibacteria group bacterium]|jgi:F-type H+-transporting ATPase subunit delta
MKISAKQYARGLYEAVQEKKDGEVKGVLKKFIEVLVKNNDFKKAKDVIRNLDKIFREEEGILEAEIVVASPLKKEMVKIVKDYVTEASGAKKVEVAERVDKNILGGIIIKYEDKIIDGSLKSRLSRLKMELAK